MPGKGMAAIIFRRVVPVNAIADMRIYFTYVESKQVSQERNGSDRKIGGAGASGL